MTIKIISKKEFLEKNKKPEQEQVWNSIAKTWNQYVVKKIPIVVDFLKNKKGNIIDLGCGDGRNMISNSNITYYGVDFSQDSLNHAEKRAKKEKINIKLFKKQTDNLSEFKDDFFDYGLFIATLHCLETKQKRQETLKEFFRVLKPNAQALITTWDSEDKRFKSVNHQGDIYMSWKENNQAHMRYYYLFKKQELIDLLKQTGFKILEFYKPQEKDRFSKKNWIIRIKKPK
ncbi:MAG: class I SAM-dependent methyltransferase [archaeon]